MTLYVVFKEGVYRHECGGVFSSQALAEAHARHLASADVDSYHNYDVVPFVLDEPHGPGAGRHGWDDPDHLFRVSKGK